MENKKEIEVNQKDAYYILYIILIPVTLSFFIQHLGEFNYKGYGTGVDNYRITEAHFTTPLGNSVFTAENEGYEQHSDGSYKIKGYYLDKLPFYLKGMIKDGLYTFALIGFLILVFFFKKKYSIKLT